MKPTFYQKLIALLIALHTASYLQATVVDQIEYNLYPDKKEATAVAAYGIEKLFIPKEITVDGETYKVTRIGKNDSSSWESVTEVVFEDGGVTSIGSYTFYGCSKITHITLPEGLIDMGYQTFKGTSISEIVIPEGVTIIWWTFEGCEKLTNVTLPESLIDIYWLAFKDCTQLTHITIPKNVRLIGQSAFQNCTGLTSITVPENVTYIASDAFEGCTGLEKIEILGRLERGGSYPVGEENTPIYTLACNFPWISNKNKVAIGPEITCTKQEVARYSFNLSYHNNEKYTTEITQISLSGGKTIEQSASGEYSLPLCPGETYDINIDYILNGTPHRYAHPVQMPLEREIMKGYCPAHTRTATSATVRMSCRIDESIRPDKWGIIVDSKEYTSAEIIPDPENEGWYYKEFHVTGLKPDTEYPCRLFIEKKDMEYYDKEKGEYVTEDKRFEMSSPGASFRTSLPTIRPSIQVEAGATRAAFAALFENPGHIAIDSCEFWLDGQMPQKSDTTYTVAGLKPDTDYTVNFAFYTAYYTRRRVIKRFRTGILDFATLPARECTATSAIVSAETNCDTPENAGFEWKRADAPESDPAERTACTVDGSTMHATLRNLQAGTTYRYRPYYQANDGTCYYGEEMQFQTPAAIGLHDVYAEKAAEPEVSIRLGKNTEISVRSEKAAECTYRLTSLDGSRVVAGGTIATDGEWQSIDARQSLKGWYLLILTDGQKTVSRKILIK